MSATAPSESAFAAEARSFLDAHAERRRREAFVWGSGDEGRFRILKEVENEAELAMIAAAKVWRALRFDHGFGWITGPEALGGRDLPFAYELLYREIEAEYDVPDQTCFIISLGMVAPTIVAAGSDALRAQYVRALYRGELIGCQLFSEPGAGSDLAAIRTRATRDGEDWIVSGQKVWTSLAHRSDIGELICRTDPGSQRHHGLTAFIIDMNAPGVTVRPILQMTGGSTFNEVFFDNVRVSDSQRIGDVGGGWKVAITTLMNERASIGAAPIELEIAWLCAMARHYNVHTAPAMREALGALHVHFETAKFLAEEGVSRLRRGEEPDPAMSVAKLVGTDALSEATAVVSRILGPRLVADTGEWGAFAFSDLLLGFPGLRLGGGSDEIQRNTIGERVLGLPRENRA